MAWARRGSRTAPVYYPAINVVGVELVSARNAGRHKVCPYEFRKILPDRAPEARKKKGRKPERS